MIHYNYKKKLVAYAAAAGVALSLPEAHALLKSFRENFPAAAQFTKAVKRRPYLHWVHRVRFHENNGGLEINGRDLRLFKLWASHPNKGRNNRVKSHCPAGHAYSKVNTLLNNQGARVCRTCKRARDRKKG